MVCFVKYQGAGNDFILIDDRAHSFDQTRVKFLCNRKFGIGADGVILLQKDLRMRIFNSDGSEAESCGNGLRCLMKFLLHLGFPRKPYRITTGNRIVEADFVGERISVQMGAPRDVQQHIINDYTIHSLDTGVPHAVLFVPDVQKVDLATLGAFFRHHPIFQPRGTNVNFAQVQIDGSIRVRTYERGLEGESLACGTGAAAVASIARQIHGLANPIHIHFPGGTLEMHVDETEVRMVGDAIKVFEGCC
jgi:diaminopimelate epimerase